MLATRISGYPELCIRGLPQSIKGELCGVIRGVTREVSAVSWLSHNFCWQADVIRVWWHLPHLTAINLTSLRSLLMLVWVRKAVMWTPKDVGEYISFSAWCVEQAGLRRDASVCLPAPLKPPEYIEPLHWCRDRKRHLDHHAGKPFNFLWKCYGMGRKARCSFLS